jgi:hypothetical protein
LLSQQRHNDRFHCVVINAEYKITDFVSARVEGRLVDAVTHHLAAAAAYVAEGRPELASWCRDEARKLAEQAGMDGDR